MNRYSFAVSGRVEELKFFTLLIWTIGFFFLFSFLDEVNLCSKYFLDYRDLSYLRRNDLPNEKRKLERNSCDVSSSQMSNLSSSFFFLLNSHCDCKIKNSARGSRARRPIYRSLTNWLREIRFFRRLVICSSPRSFPRRGFLSKAHRRGRSSPWNEPPL